MPDASAVLGVLDRFASAFTFPMLDNGYVYLAATRLSAFGDGKDWAIVIEVFGYSPRAGVPDLSVHTFGSRLVRRVDSTAEYVSAHPNDEFVSFIPLADGPWIDEEYVAPDAIEVELRGVRVPLPERATYAQLGIPLVHADRTCRCAPKFALSAHRKSRLRSCSEGEVSDAGGVAARAGR